VYTLSWFRGFRFQEWLREYLERDLSRGCFGRETRVNFMSSNWKAPHSRGVVLLRCLAKGFQRAFRPAPAYNPQFHIS
jgi:hypothetical protein